MRRIVLAAAFAALALWACAAPAAVVAVMELDGAVSPASAAQFHRALAAAAERRAELLVLRLDTPGGLDAAMRDMIRDILSASMPVAVYVAPSGARAASAGTYLMYAAHVAAMAPGTNLGAATPVSLGIGGGREPEARKDAPGEAKPAAGGTTMERKAAQDAAAYLRSLAQLRGRDAGWVQQAVLESASLSASEALERGVIDVVAADLPSLLVRIDGRRVATARGERTLATRGAELVTIDANWKERVLARLADPNIALLLLVVGFYGLLFEFLSPGFAVPGVAGGICLLLAAYGLQVLPVNAVGVLLIVLGLGLMAAEAFTPSFGLLGAGGAVSFIAGALMLIEPDARAPGFMLSPALVVTLGLGAAVAVAGTAWLALRARRRPAASGTEAMIGEAAVVLEDFVGRGRVQAHGETWQAASRVPLKRGQRVRIAAIRGLTLELEAPEPREDLKGDTP